MAVAETAEFVLARQSGEIAFEQTLDECQAGVKYLAGRLANRLPAHVDVEDLIQVGLLGLLQCVQRFDARRGVKFQTYANRRVQGAMLDYLRSLDWRPRSVRKRSRRLAQAVAAVEQRTGESASEEELAFEMGMTASELRQWLADYSSRGEHAAVAHYDRDADESSEDLLALIADPADSPETQTERKQLAEKLAQAIERLPENERVVCSLYYFEQRTMKQIGRVLGVKQARVSQLHSQALRRLRLRMRRDARPHTLPAALPLAMPVPPVAEMDPILPQLPPPAAAAACETGRAA
jgi:RNA polymerase sigma factor for flagellar operon FliA